MSPVISVLMPAYNSERYISAALDSVLAQTFTDFEVVIVDDGSTDGTLATLRKYADRDKRIKLITRPNTGIVGALNDAIAASQGEFLARMDSDDICDPRRFELQLAYMREHPDCVLLGSNVLLMDSDGARIGPMLDVCSGHDQIDHALLQGGWPIVHPSVMLRADAVRKVGGYIGKCPNEDHDLFLRLMEIGRGENLPELLLHYRKHTSSITVMQDHLISANIMAIVQDACRRRGIEVPETIKVANHRPKSVYEMQRFWAWQAMKHKNIRTARKYALATLRHRPLSLDSWRLAFCAVRGH
jgi:glycosyltransferase involved in cell wall biosynthesis